MKESCDDMSLQIRDYCSSMKLELIWTKVLGWTKKIDSSWEDLEFVQT